MLHGMDGVPPPAARCPGARASAPLRCSPGSGSSAAAPSRSFQAAAVHQAWTDAFLWATVAVHQAGSDASLQAAAAVHQAGSVAFLQAAAAAHQAGTNASLRRCCCCPPDRDRRLSLPSQPTRRGPTPLSAAAAAATVHWVGTDASLRAATACHRAGSDPLHNAPISIQQH